MTLDKLMEYGHMLVQEQENVKRVQLADKYLCEAGLGDANEDAIKTGSFYGKAAQLVRGMYRVRINSPGTVNTNA
jgi:hypothetical protein